MVNRRVGRIALFCLYFFLSVPLFAHARLLGGTDCTETPINDAPPEMYAYSLDCPTDTAKLTEMVGVDGRFALGQIVPKNDNAKPYTIQYVPAQGSASITAVGDGSALPTGSKGTGGGLIQMLGQSWRCSRAALDDIDKSAHATAKSVCARADEVKPLPSLH
jgi:hypothetical protein